MMHGQKKHQNFLLWFSGGRTFVLVFSDNSWLGRMYCWCFLSG